MSPSRTRKPVAKVHPRREILKAVGAAVGVVVGTALIVYLIRPGADGQIGGGGLFSRQPRVTWLFVLTAAAMFFAVRWALRSRRTRGRRKVIVPIVVGLVLVAGVIAGFFWPGGLIKDYPKAPELFDPSTVESSVPIDTTPVDSSLPTDSTAPGDSTTPGTNPTSETTTPGTTEETVPPTTG